MLKNVFNLVEEFWIWTRMKFAVAEVYVSVCCMHFKRTPICRHSDDVGTSSALYVLHYDWSNFDGTNTWMRPALTYVQTNEPHHRLMIIMRWHHSVTCGNWQRQKCKLTFQCPKYYTSVHLLCGSIVTTIDKRKHFVDQMKNRMKE